ncbi:hypothetical protein KKG83_03340 [Candidatus Micrarchaeota archaeon]|nr:hypothetical protein [Candidatus Micrarchaeota archaeon]MBU2476479.1 hypothetical protein [Candidatus Micrarchaeota archaeon]
MDLFNLILAVIFLMMATQWGPTWLIGGIVLILIIAMRDLKSTIILLVAAIALYFIKDNIQEYALFVIIGLILLAMVLGKKADEGGQPEMFNPGGFGGLMEGM